MVAAASLLTALHRPDAPCASFGRRLSHLDDDEGEHAAQGEDDACDGGAALGSGQDLAQAGVGVLVLLEMKGSGWRGASLGTAVALRLVPLCILARGGA